MTELYRVEKTTKGEKEFLTAPVELPAALEHLKQLTRNMVANNWLRIDNVSTRGLPVVMLAHELRTVTLAVVLCGGTPDHDSAVDLREFPWLLRTVEPILNGSEETQDYTINAEMETPTDGLFADELVSELKNVTAEVAKNG